MSSSTNVWLLCSATGSFWPLLWSKYPPGFTSQPALEDPPAQQVGVQGTRAGSWGTCAPTHTRGSQRYPWFWAEMGDSGAPGELYSIFLCLALSRPNSRLGTCVLSSSQFSNGSLHQNPLTVASSAGLGSWQVISIPYKHWGILIKWLQRFVSASPLLNKSAIWEADFILLILSNCLLCWISKALMLGSVIPQKGNGAYCS